MTAPVYHDPAIDLLCETARRLMLSEVGLQAGLLCATGVLLHGAAPAVGTAAWMIRTGRAAADGWVQQQPAMAANVVDLRARRPCGRCPCARAAGAWCRCECHWPRPALAGAAR